MRSRFARAMEEKVLVIDGAMGTAIQACDLDLARDYLGRENCTEVVVLTRPEVIQKIHEGYLEAGADAVETDTFGANKLVFAEFDLVDRTYEINKRAAEVAGAACARFAAAGRPRFVIGSMGPGTRLLTLGHTTWDVMQDSYAEQARGLIDGGVDALAVETCQDILQAKCAIAACLLALGERGRSPEEIPILASVTIETTGTMLVGTDIAAAAEALKGYPILSLGLNCATGPEEMAEHIHWLGKHWDRPITVYPNAGLPQLKDGKTHYPLTPDALASNLLRFIDEDGVQLVGGCCGTNHDHIRRLAEVVGTRRPALRRKTILSPGCSSLYAAVPFRQDTSFLIVGERTNANGSRRFKRLLAEENWDALVSMGREQVKEGAHIVDLSVDAVGRDGVRDMTEVVKRFAQAVSAPLMIDSTQVDVLEAGLKHAPGKCVINSMNLEDGEEKLARICRLARTYGAAVVAGTIDDDPEEAMGKTAARKLGIAERIHDLAVRKYGLQPEDLLFDPLVLPITTGVRADRRLALETIEGVRRISARFPRCQTLLGISNVSFGLAPAARVVLNSVFLHECVEAGLTGAIVHAAKILPKNRIDPAAWDAALDLVYDRWRDGRDPLTHFIALFPADQGEDAPARATLASLPIEDRLRRHVIDGERQGLVETLDEALSRYPALEIVNDHLLAGMKTVGELFGAGEMQLPFVLQSAEVMKAAVKHLEPHMPKTGGRPRGKMVLATVKGDVHDIGKNLVDIILTNNGYEVVNLGIKQPVHAILEALERERADSIGLSGLLVKSVGVMQENLEEMARLGLTIPVILGGAALTRDHAEETLRGIYPRTYYGNDAFEGLRFMDHLASGRMEVLDSEVAERVRRFAGRRAVEAAERARPLQESVERAVATDVPVPEPPFWGSRVAPEIDLAEIYPFINRVALFRGQWQFRKGQRTSTELTAEIEREALPVLLRLQDQCRSQGILRPAVVYGYFPVQSSGEDLIVFDPEDRAREIERFTFPRQRSGARLCIADFFRPVESGVMDVLGLHCVTVGDEASRRAQTLYEGNAYQEYLFLHGFAVETAEALAEFWHKRMRAEMGIAGSDALEVADLFNQRYRGSRYSFGYPACPELSDQAKLFRLLAPERIGCRLTENWQIEPEQSTSALIAHHPEAKYFRA